MDSISAAAPARPIAALPTPPPAERALAPITPEVAEALSVLANLIDSSIRIRGTGIEVRDWAASHLGVTVAEVSVTTAGAGPLDAQLMALALAEDLREHGPLDSVGSDQEEAPEWIKLDLGEVNDRVPCELAARFPAGTVADGPTVVQVSNPYRSPGLSFRVYSRTGDVDAAERYLDSLRERSRARTNPFRNRVLETTSTQVGLAFKAVTLPPSGRDDVVVPASVWQALDRNVVGLYAALEHLAAAGLATNRGVLLAGPPGTGKTALCRVLAAELAGTVTVVFCDASTVSDGIRPLYRELVHLAPALVVIEDVDLVVGDRAHGAGSALLDFLVALDGAMSGHTGVVTLATTNDPRAIDPAARRSARFDVLVEVPAPDAAGRAAILGRYLRELDAAAVGPVDLDRVAAATEGMTGADLRELVSDAVLHLAVEAGGGATPLVPDTSLLVRLARERRQRPAPGLYL